jgi:integrase
MTRPTKHPKTGVYRLRKQIPAALRDVAASLFGVRGELITSLGTKDPDEARQRAPVEIARLEVRMAAIKAAFKSGTVPSLTAKQVQALAGQFYAEEAAKWEDNPGPPAYWEEVLWKIHDQAEYVDVIPENPGDRSVELVPRATDEDLQLAVEAIAKAGLVASQADTSRVSEAIVMARWGLANVMGRRASGDWSPDENLGRFPVLPKPVPTLSAAATISGLTLDRLLEGWALDHGWRLDAPPIPRALYDRVRTMERLAGFLGHRDANAVTKADVVRWKEDMQERGRQVPTIRNDISEMSAIWRGALRAGKLKSDANPFDGVAPPKPKRQTQGRRAFTDAEAVQILTAARLNSGYMRWLPWLCCLTGARLSEACQGTKEDVTEMDGVMVLRIHDDAATDGHGGVQSLKNAESRRVIPVHPALVAEGFLEYVNALPARSPLFPDAKPDKQFGLRSTNAGKKISRWLKADLLLNDPRISPNHSWRHWFVDACRKVTMSPEVRSALTGHSATRDESDNYGAGMKSMVQVLAENIGTVRCPLVSPAIMS